jgi:hypothetical protein
MGKREELVALLGPVATTLLKKRQSISQAYTRERKKIWDQQLNRDQQLLLLSPLPFPGNLDKNNLKSKQI